ncbi:hypothetical protein ACH5RR_036191 [Cinchona calisaya]|uniref:Cysteine--tRNA ligase n=1 Tax=Cinchona calisaya TaxID=153742 RepID=A0ABD2Y5P6_9GENT
MVVMDLIFPHHENETAQSSAACSESNVTYWVYNGFVTVTKLYHLLAPRHFLLGMHYRSPVNYSTSQIEIASDAIFYIYQTLKDAQEALAGFREKNKTNDSKASISQEVGKCIKNLRKEILTKMSDDLHTSTILNAALLEALRLINSSVERLKLKEKALMRAGLTEDDILIKIEERARARKVQEWGESDKIRTKLAALGIALMDVGKETIWRPCVPIQQENPVDPVQQEHADVPCVSTDKEQRPTHGSS